MSRSSVIRPAPVLALLLLAAACVPRQQTTPTAPPQPTPPPVVEEPAEPEGPPRVALLLPLSGDTAALGADLQDAAHLALFDIGFTDLELLTRDTGGTAAGAASALRDALADGAELVLGPLFGREVTAVAPVARAADVKVLAFSNDARVAGGGVWVLGYGPGEQVTRIVGHARDQGLDRLGALVPDDAYGAVVAEAWRRALADEPAAATAVAFYPTDGDASGAVRGLIGRGGGLDGLLVPEGGLGLQQMAAYLAFFEVDTERTRLLGTARWRDDESVLTDPTLGRAWIAAPPPDHDRAFAEQFQTVYGRVPDPLAGLAYDAVALAALIARIDRTYPADILTDPAGFQGRSGVFRLLPDGTSEHGLAILELDGGAWRIREPAPRSFAPAFVGN
jgi:ABC-type branched-subunit amino acid transport system substrate-binding protein